MSLTRAASLLWLIIIAFWDGSVLFGHWTQSKMSGIAIEWTKNGRRMGIMVHNFQDVCWEFFQCPWIVINAAGSKEYFREIFIIQERNGTECWHTPSQCTCLESNGTHKTPAETKIEYQMIIFIQWRGAPHGKGPWQKPSKYEYKLFWGLIRIYY